MKVGSFIGKGKIYNKKGKPILKPNEKVLKKYKAKCGAGWVKKRGFSKYILSHTILHYHPGTIYLTNKRFIYIRPPLSWKKIRTYEGYHGLNRAINYGLRAQDMKMQGVLEFIEFEYEEIDQIKKGLLWSYFKFILPDMDILVTPENYIIEEVKRFTEN